MQASTTIAMTLIHHRGLHSMMKTGLYYVYNVSRVLFFMLANIADITENASSWISIDMLFIVSPAHIQYSPLDE